MTALLLSILIILLLSSLQLYLPGVDLTKSSLSAPQLGPQLGLQLGASLSHNLWGGGGLFLGLILLTLWLKHTQLSQANPTLKIKKIIRIFLFLLRGSSFLSSLFYLYTYFAPSKLTLNLTPQQIFLNWQFLLVASPSFIPNLIPGFKSSTKTTLKRSLGIGAISLFLFGFGLNSYSLLQVRSQLQIQPWLSSLSVATKFLTPAPGSHSTSSTWLKLLFGFGPSNYQLGFHHLKPSWLNQTHFASTYFSQATNLPLTLIISTGILGLGAYLWLLSLAGIKTFQVLTQARLQKKSPQTSKSTPKALLALNNLSLSLILLLAILEQLIFPPSLGLLFVFGLTLSLLFLNHAWAELPGLKLPWPKLSQSKFSQWPKLSQSKLSRLNPPSFFWTLLWGGVGVGTLILLWTHLQTTLAWRAWQQNRPHAAYTHQQRALRFNPLSPHSQRQYSLISFQLAAALQQKTDLTSAEKTKTGQLIQQALRAALFTTTLQPTNPDNYLLLGQIYQNLIGVTPGAEELTLQAYSQALVYSPHNIELVIKLGETFYTLEEFEAAEKMFAQAEKMRGIPNDIPNDIPGIESL